jgi:hypothetical protein
MSRDKQYDKYCLKAGIENRNTRTERLGSAVPAAAPNDTRNYYADGYEAGYQAGMAEKKPWVGLTDEDKNNCLVSADPCESLSDPEAQQLMKDVEAKLKEKNGG